RAAQGQQAGRRGSRHSREATAAAVTAACQGSARPRRSTAWWAGRPLLVLRGALAVLLAGHALALAQEDGRRFKAGDIVYALAVAPDGDGLVVGSRDSSVYRLDPSGALRWQYRTGGTVY